MKNKITLEQLTNFIRTKTDFNFANFQYNESAIDSKNIIILQANYDNESYNAVCDNNVDSLLNLIVKIFSGDKKNTLRSYLLGEEGEIYNVLFRRALVLELVPIYELKDKIAETILEDLNG